MQLPGNFQEHCSPYVPIIMVMTLTLPPPCVARPIPAEPSSCPGAHFKVGSDLTVENGMLGTGGGELYPKSCRCEWLGLAGHLIKEEPVP